MPSAFAPTDADLMLAGTPDPEAIRDQVAAAGHLAERAAENQMPSAFQGMLTDPTPGAGPMALAQMALNAGVKLGDGLLNDYAGTVKGLAGAVLSPLTATHQASRMEWNPDDPESMAAWGRQAAEFGLGMAGVGAPAGAANAARAAEEGASVLGTAGSRFAFPPPENARLTQVATTGGTYDKAAEFLRGRGVDGPILDYGAGRGHGARSIGADSFEPYATGWSPTYTDPRAIPSDAYQGLLNLNVLNVLPKDMRAEAVENMGRVLRPEGHGIITTRGRKVMDAKGTPGPEPMSLVIGTGDQARYQKGFRQEELLDEINGILGSRFDVSPLKLGEAGVSFRRRYASGGLVDGDQPYTPEQMEAQASAAAPSTFQGMIDHRIDLDQSTAPMQRLAQGAMRLGQAAWEAPGQVLGAIAGGVKDAVTAPRDAYTGDLQVWDPTTGHVSDEAIRRASDMAGMAMTGGFGGVAREGGEAILGAGPIRAYHGTPHDFDRFDISKIGSGEGAQVFGHGLYFAENPEVARIYRDKLSPWMSQESPEAYATRMLDQTGGDFDKALTALDARLKGWRAAPEHARDPGFAETLAPVARLLETRAPVGTGRMYEVNIAHEPHEFIDWDAPMNAQTAGEVLRGAGPTRAFETRMQKAQADYDAMEAPLRRMMEDPSIEYGTPQYDAIEDGMLAARAVKGELERARQLDPRALGSSPETFEALHGRLRHSSVHNGTTFKSLSQPEIAATLRDYGMPGVRYLDQFSRRAGAKNPTHNMVLYDDKPVSIVRKYADGGLVDV